jgi:S-formylglutathione hydrolase FrmB
VRIELARDHADEVTATLSRRIPPPAADDDDDNPGDASPAAAPVQWLTRRSKQLGAALHRTTDMRVGVVLPYGYDDLSFPRRMWPTIYVLGDFGASHRDALFAAAALRDPNARAAVPQAVWVFLEPTTPWGASGFCDSDANGPVARALVDELIPALEERFRLIPQANARVLLGHGFGGWAAIHLALTAPSVFGSCYASAPDFVDFSALGTIDLYRDQSLFVARDGSEAPALRSILGPNDDLLRFTTREQIATERAIDPDGRSGERWAARDAMWSPWQPERYAPRAIVATNATTWVTATIVLYFAASLPLRASAIACPLRSSAPSAAHSFCAAFRVLCTNFLAARTCWSHSRHRSGVQVSSQVCSPARARLSYIPVPSASSRLHRTASSLVRSTTTCPASDSSARCKHLLTYASPALSWPRMLWSM